jgi:hypothetical protein
MGIMQRLKRPRNFLNKGDDGMIDNVDENGLVLVIICAIIIGFVLGVLSATECSELEPMRMECDTVFIAIDTVVDTVYGTMIVEDTVKTNALEKEIEWYQMRLDSVTSLLFECKAVKCNDTLMFAVCSTGIYAVDISRIDYIDTTIKHDNINDSIITQRPYEYKSVGLVFITMLGMACIAFLLFNIKKRM